ncbi:MAG TPA: adenylosuccinate lyase [Spirochaetia bacterium]|nr:MAG: adenylosuccinate lyase [Spirochaetes bacterium GWB1_36_13]HCL56861.1 adenylosuccinate lyase [Spirochaetia bacterium]
MSEFYSNPLVERYASKEMAHIFSSLNKYTAWHDLWIALAESEKELGLSITDEQIEEMKKNKGRFDFEKVKNYEKTTRHEVMAHIQAWGEICPKARAIMHLGATSAFVMDNGDLIQMNQGLKLLRKRFLSLIQAVSDFSEKNKEIPCLGYTHFQPAQLTTVGKRAVLWLYDLLLDYQDLTYRLENMQLRGAKGTVGTQDSFMKLFDNNHDKVKKLDQRVSEKIGFEKGSIPVSGQTYTRKIDYILLTSLSNIAQSAHKISTDIRLLQGLQELEEPFEENQIGSSAMPYKRNPMRSERVCSLSRFVMQLTGLAGSNHSVQWLERTLDDSANRRMMISEMFLAVDAILIIMTNVFKGLKVYPKMIEKRIEENLAFLSAEYVIMESVKKGKDRQDVHEAFRKAAMECVQNKKEKGIETDLVKLLIQSPDMNLSENEIRDVLNPSKMIGRAVEQVNEFLELEINPILERDKKWMKDENIELKV